MWENMPPGVVTEIRKCIIELTKEDGTFKHASLFTGSGMDTLCLLLGIEAPARDKFQLNMSLKMQYACDNGFIQERFITEAFPELCHFFETVAELKKDTAYCRKMQKRVIIPFTQLLVWCFVCKGSSKANNRPVKHGVQKGIGSTGESFAEAMEVVRRHRPPYMIIENVPALLNTVTKEDDGTISVSDAKFVEESIESEGYWIKGFVVEAYDHSSKAVRKRLKWACVEEQVRSRTREQYMKTVLVSLKLPPHPLTDFLFCNLARTKKKHRYMEDTTFQQVHAQFFLRAGLDWQPSYKDISSCGGLADCDLPQRPLESMYYCDKVFPFDKNHCDSGGFQYVDGNISLERLTREVGEFSPWLMKLGTITTKKIWMIRYVEEERVVLKCLDGGELLQLQGFHESLTPVSFLAYESADLKLLAGNALNGFSFAAFCIAFIASILQRSEEEIADTDGDEESVLFDDEDSGGDSGDTVGLSVL